MQNHEFERQVQQRMEQIKFTPSDTVWAGVEKNLKQRRKRRIAFVWFFFLCLLAVGGAWWAYSPGSSNKNIAGTEALKNEQSVTEKNKENSVANNIAVEERARQFDSTKTNGIGQLDAKKNTISPLTEKANNKLTAVQQSNKFSLSYPTAHNPHHTQSFNAGSQSGRNNKLKEKRSPQKNNNKIQPVIEEDDVNIDITAGNIASTNADKETASKTNTASADSAQAPEKIIAKTTDLQKDSAVVAAPTIKPSKKSKWQFGVTASVGVADITEGISAQKSYSNASSFTGNFVSAPGPVQNVGNLYVYPSELQSGASFSVGVAGRKKIKKRLSLSVGLQYHYYSNSLQVGRKLDSMSSALSGASYLAAGPRVTDHRNTYHFIELPVSLEWQLLKSRPLFLSAGFSFAQLVSSNALTYDYSRGIYYSDQNNLNKTQLNLRTGLAWSFWDKKPVSLQVGPSFQYGISNLAKKSVNGSNHLYTFGIDARILFHRK